MRDAKRPYEFLFLVTLFSSVGIFWHYVWTPPHDEALLYALTFFFLLIFYPPELLCLWITQSSSSTVPLFAKICPFLVHPAYWALFFLPAKSLFALRHDPESLNENRRRYKSLVRRQWLFAALQVLLLIGIIGLSCYQEQVRQHQEELYDHGMISRPPSAD